MINLKALRREPEVVPIHWVDGNTYDIELYPPRERDAIPIRDVWKEFAKVIEAKTEQDSNVEHNLTLNAMTRDLDGKVLQLVVSPASVGLESTDEVELDDWIYSAGKLRRLEEGNVELFRKAYELCGIYLPDPEDSNKEVEGEDPETPFSLPEQPENP